mmetsp:Transcript_2521/g.2149  ORF Transcript_2521/g.2149 Transcript_2521/m.2149 type:complete len:122 (+) Transcript_2521:4091-4456(+)
MMLEKDYESVKSHQELIWNGNTKVESDPETYYLYLENTGINPASYDIVINSEGSIPILYEGSEVVVQIPKKEYQHFVFHASDLMSYAALLLSFEIPKSKAKKGIEGLPFAIYYRSEKSTTG